MIALALSGTWVVAGVMLVAGAVPASGMGPYPVNSTFDAIDSNVHDGRCESTPGNCTLRAAIMQAEQDGGGTVVLQQGLGDFHLTIPAGDEGDSKLPCPKPPDPIPPRNSCPDGNTGDLDIRHDIHVMGNGVADSVIDGTHLTRIFDVHAGGSLTLTDLTLQNGNSEWDGEAQHAHGGAIHNHGTIRLERVAVINSTSDQPTDNWGGGGITNASDAVAELYNVTIAGNNTNFEGGGIENKGTLDMAFVTIANNSAFRCSSHSLHPRSRPADRRYGPRARPPCLVRVAGQGAGIFLAAGSTTVAVDTIVAKNTPGKDCMGPGTVKSFGGNIQGDGSCGFTAVTDHTGDPGFDSTRFGPPLFFPLLATSPAVDVPTTVLCGVGLTGVDIRGTVRPQGGDPDGDGVANCDSGSFELEPGALPAMSIRNARVREGQRGTKKIRFIVSLSASPKHTVKVHVTTRDGTARAGFDYVARSAALVFKPGQRHKTFTVAVIGDHKRERDETFTVHLSVAKGARITDAEATGTILNDD